MKAVPEAITRPANAKVNLRLEVGPRAGERHLLVSVIASLELADELRFTPSSDPFEVKAFDPQIPERENLIWRAAHALGVHLPNVVVSVSKRIPLQAGLGGGSADAAAALIGLASILQRNGQPLSPTQIRDAAAQVGSDVPSALLPGLKIVGGTGEAVAPYACAAPPWGVVLIKPVVGSVTGRAYALLDEAGATHAIDDDAFDRARSMCHAFASHDFTRFLELLHNDFDPVIERAFPEVVSVRERLSGSGAAGTILCGSGSCVAGFFADRGAADAAVEHIKVNQDEWLTVTGFWHE